MAVWIKLCVPLLVMFIGSGAAIFFTPQDARGLAVLILGIFMCISIFAIYKLVEPLTQLVNHIEGLNQGNLLKFTASLESEDEFGRLTKGLSEHTTKLSDLSQKASNLASGDIKLGSLEKHLKSSRLSGVDLPIPRDSNQFETNLHVLQNQLRRLTIQAQIIANDQLNSPLLNERVSGDLGEAFGRMVTNLRQLAERANKISDGDLSFDTTHEGDLNKAFGSMVENIKEIVAEIIQNTVHISTSAEEILMVLREQELAASHQASSVEETQRTMVTLLSSAKKIAESAQTVFKSAERAQANNRLISERASELKNHTERIGEILETIKAIADRSDLLALNASLEGLRAGESGKGFTLVAGEMRRLAENIKGSVGDIKELLSDIRESALSSVMAIEEGTRLSERTTDSALKITLITQQQQSGTEQVTQSMEELSHLINQGLAGTREVTIAATELASLSDQMRQLVDGFHTDPNANEKITSNPTHIPTSLPVPKPYNPKEPIPKLDIPAELEEAVAKSQRAFRTELKPTRPIGTSTPDEQEIMEANTVERERPVFSSSDAPPTIDMSYLVDQEEEAEDLSDVSDAEESEDKS